MKGLVVKEAIEFVRDRRLLVAVLATLLLALVAAGLAATDVANYERDRVAAAAGDRATWLGQGEQNPHGAAHFANWAFRPLTAAALIDPGATPYAPVAIWLEAHNQNTGVGRAVEDEVRPIDFGRFSLAWVLQTVLPLVIFVLAAGLVARERERGTLRQLLIAGVRPRQVVGAKGTALGGIVLAVLAPLGVAVTAAFALSPAPVTPDQVARVLALFGLYAGYLAIYAAIGLAVSVWAGRTDRALVTLVSLWILFVVIGPRVGGAVADLAAPTPHAQAFTAQLDRDYQQGLPGDPDADTRRAQLEERTLARYGVDDVKALPVSFSGVSLDASERYAYRIFDLRYGELQAIRDEQRNWIRALSVVSPLIAAQNVSAGLAGTDEAHVRAFAAQAEAHRRVVVNRLNGDLIQNGAGKTYAGYKVGEAFWRTLPEFRFDPPRLGDLSHAWLPDLLILLAWLSGAVAALVLSVRRLTGSEV